MKMSIHEKVDQLTTSLMDVAGLPETIKDGQKLERLLKQSYEFERVTLLRNPTKAA